MSVEQVLDRIQQVTAAVGRDRADEPGTTRIAGNAGLTISLLGILLTICAALASGERSLLTRALLEQTKARAEYHAQDVKHRVAVVALQQVHATRHGADATVRQEASRLALTVERYLDESRLARDWSESFDPLVTAHVDAAQGFDRAQQCLEVAVLLISLAMLINGWRTWMAGLALGFVAAGLMGTTYLRDAAPVNRATIEIAVAAEAYRASRDHGRTTDAERMLLADVRGWASEPAVH
jgi:hypothetical protein